MSLRNDNLHGYDGEESMTVTEDRTEAAPPEGRCNVGSATASPCRFPATVALPDRLPGAGPHMCAFHAATEPLVDEQNEAAGALEKAQEYLEDARGYHAPALIALLERAEEDFSARLALANKVLDDLTAAEHALMR